MARSWSCKLALGVGVALFFAVCVLPALTVLQQSFFRDGALSTAAYHTALGTRQLVLLGRSVALGAASAAGALLLGVPIGLLISRTDLPARRVFWLLCLPPLIVPPYINAVAWIELAGEHGLLSRLLSQALTIEQPPWSIYRVTGAAWVFAASFWPLVALLSAAAFRAVDGASEDSARLEGGPWTVIRHVTLPLAAPVIVAGGLFVFLLAVTDLGTPDLLYLMVYTKELYAHFVASFDTAVAGASCVPLLGAGLLTVALMWSAARRTHASPFLGERAPPRDFSLGRWRAPACALLVVVLLITVGLPLGTLVAKAGGGSNYLAALRGSSGQCVHSLWYAACGAVGGTVLALPMSYLVCRGRGRRPWMLAALALVPIAVPGVVTGIGLAALWSSAGFAHWLPRGELMLPGGRLWEVDWRAIVVPIGYTARFAAFAMTARFAAFAMGATVAALLQVDRSFEEAAAVGGASWWQGMRHVVVPLIRRGMLAGWAIVFILGMREVATSILVHPPGRDTLAIRLFQMMHYGADAQVAALSIILIVITLACVGVLAWPILSTKD